MVAKLIVVLSMLVFSIASANAQVNIGIGLPHVSIGINLPLYPRLERVPGYPVYYAPRLDANYFFYDGMYWVYQEDNWYASSWYNGPWRLVGPADVPLYILRVPVRYYRQPPAYFHGWRSNSPPRWGEHWGNDWAQRRGGWDHWNRKAAPAPAPLPSYQRKYSGDRYPEAEQQQALRSRNYRYQPRDATARQHYQGPPGQSAPAPAPRGPQGMPHQRPFQQQPESRRQPQDAGPPGRGRPQDSGREHRPRPENNRERTGDRGQDRNR